MVMGTWAMGMGQGAWAWAGLGLGLRHGCHRVAVRCLTLGNTRQEANAEAKTSPAARMPYRDRELQAARFSKIPGPQGAKHGTRDPCASLPERIEWHRMKSFGKVIISCRRRCRRRRTPEPACLPASLPQPEPELPLRGCISPEKRLQRSVKLQLPILPILASAPRPNGVAIQCRQPWVLSPRSDEIRAACHVYRPKLA
jgi:hypothetical protein